MSTSLPHFFKEYGYCCVLIAILIVFCVTACSKHSSGITSTSLDITIDEIHLHGSALQYPTIGLSGQLMKSSQSASKNTAIRTIHATFNEKDYYGLVVFPIAKSSDLEEIPTSSNLTVYARLFEGGIDVRVKASVDFSLVFSSNQNLQYFLNDSGPIQLPVKFSPGEYHIKAIYVRL